MNLEGKILGNRYEILEKIGVGGMATVYKAKCKVLNRYVAVKVLREEFTTDIEFIRRFNTEAQSAASLTHPNIVSVYDVGNEGNLYYIVMELIQGKTLKDIINQDGMLPWKWSTNITIQIASALEMAHRNNIIHRDIKPHNIIITEEGIAKVTDFGIAKAVSNSTITAFGTTIGSVHYFSPEHARGGYTDAKSDLYSLGVVMYEMLTGRVPFDADTPVSIALKHMQEEAVEPIKINPNIPISLNNIIVKAMQKEANLRYSSATEMLKDLRMVLKNPEEDFVVMKEICNDFPTQRIPIMSDENINTGKKRNSKKQNKFIQYLNEHKGAKIFTIIIACIFIFVATIGITYGIIELTRKEEIQIPELVGLSKEEAEKQTKDLKLILEIQYEEFNSEVPAGYIISQDPPYMENYKILEKSVIKVVVSKGQEIVKLPKVTGKTKEEAEKILTELGLVPEIIEENNKKVQEGYVIRQEPNGDTEVEGKSTVKIYISKGIKKVVVPDLMGKTEEEAKKAISDAGLKLITVKKDKDSTKTDGVVIKQDIDSGKEVEDGAGITITINELPKISKGTVNINVKSLLGYTEQTDVNGITIEPKTVEVRVEVNGDTVYKQNHKQNTQKVSVGIEGVGIVEVKVFIDGIRQTQQQLDLSSNNPVLNVD